MAVRDDSGGISRGQGRGYCCHCRRRQPGGIESKRRHGCEPAAHSERQTRGRGLSNERRYRKGEGVRGGFSLRRGPDLPNLSAISKTETCGATSQLVVLRVGSDRPSHCRLVRSAWNTGRTPRIQTPLVERSSRMAVLMRALCPVPHNNALKRTSSRFSLPARRLTQCSTG